MNEKKKAIIKNILTVLLVVGAIAAFIGVGLLYEYLAINVW